MAKTVSKEPVTRVTGSKEEKLKTLDSALTQIEKKFGKGSIMKLGESLVDLNVEAIPTGSISLDIALGIGGIPRGRVVEVYGPESSGKTTVTLHMVAEVQKKGGIAAFIDAEHALDPVYAKNIGVDIDHLYISQPDSGEQALEICETMVRSGAVDLVVVDSVAALVPQAEIDGDMGDSVMGMQARLMSQALRKLTSVISKSNCTSSVRLEVRRVESLKSGGEIIGNHVRVKVVKNKVAPPFKEAEFDIMFGEGISRVGDVLDTAINYEIVDKSGSWITYNKEKIGQGRENAKQFLKDNPEIFDEIELKVREAFKKDMEEKNATYSQNTPEVPEEDDDFDEDEE